MTAATRLMGRVSQHALTPHFLLGNANRDKKERNHESQSNPEAGLDRSRIY